MMNAIGHIVNACYYMQESFDNKTHEKNDKRIIDTVGHTGNACRTRIVCQNVVNIFLKTRILLKKRCEFL